jgi:hypothetical protein
MNRYHRHMATAEHGNAALAFVLQEGKLLGKGIDPIKVREIQRLTQGHPHDDGSKLAVVIDPA